MRVLGKSRPIRPLAQFAVFGLLGTVLAGFWLDPSELLNRVKSEPGQTEDLLCTSSSTNRLPPDVHSLAWDDLPGADCDSQAEALTEARYAIEPSRVPGEQGAPRAINYQQNYRICFDETGPTLAERGSMASWAFSLHAHSYGRMGAEVSLEGLGTRHAAGTRMEYRHGNLTEWYINRPVGLEQGFTIATPPAKGRSGNDAQPLVVRMQVAGDLAPTLVADGKRIEFKDQRARKVLSYEKLVAFDVAGRTLPSLMEVSGTTLSLLVDDSGAQYPVTIDPVVVTLIKRLTGPDGVSLGGEKVCIDGDLAVTVSGETVHVFRRNDGGLNNWGYVKGIQEPGATFIREASLSGDTLMVAAREASGPNGPNTAAIYIFQQSWGGTDNWGLVKKIYRPDPEVFYFSDYFGTPSALDGDTAVISRWGVSGAKDAFVYYRNAGGPNNWGLVKTLYGYFESAAITGDRIILKGDDATFPPIGVWLFERNAGGSDNWGLKKILYPETGPDMVPKQWTGGDLAIQGDTIVAADPYYEYPNGCAYIFQKDQGGSDNWGEVTRLEAEPEPGSYYVLFGFGVAISNDVVTIGAFQERIGGLSYAGAAYAYAKDAGGPNNWGKIKKLISPDLCDHGYFGMSVGMSGADMLIGCPGTPPYGGAYIYSDDSRYVHIWDGEGATTSWHEGLNWTADTEPAPSDDVFFNEFSSKDCMTASDVEVKNLNVYWNYGGTLTFSDPQTLTINGDTVLAGGTVNFGDANFFKGNFERSGSLINRKDMYFEGAGTQELRPGPRDLVFGSLFVGDGSALQFDILGELDTTGMVANGNADVRLKASVGIFNSGTSLVSVGAQGSLTVEDGCILDARSAATFVNDGLLTESGTGKILRNASLLQITDDTGVPAAFVHGSPFYVTLADDDENLDGQASDSTTVEISNLNNGDLETMSLSETGIATGEFRNSTGFPTAIAASATVGNGTLECQVGDALRIRYTDGEDPGDVLTVVIPGDGIPTLQVMGLSFVPDSVFASSPAELTVTFNRDLDSSSVNQGSILLVRKGPDGVFGTDDDIRLQPLDLSLPAANLVRIGLNDIAIGNDTYRLILAGDDAGQALGFDGSDAFARVPDDASLDPDDALTVEAWFNFQAGGSGNPRIVSKGTGSYEIFTNGTGSSRTITASILTSGGAVAVTSPSAYAAGRWYHVALSYDRVKLRLIVDGQLVAEGLSTLPVTSDPGDLVLGRSSSPASNFFKGMIDEVRVWSTGRQAGEVASGRFKSLSGSEAGLEGYWRCDESSGQVIADATANGNDGTLGTDAAVASDDPARFKSYASLPGIRDSVGLLLDGEFSGTLPSGNGVAGGDFEAGFSIDQPLLRVTGVSPIADASVSVQPTNIVVTLDDDVDPDSVTSESVRLVHRGEADASDERYDVDIPLTQITVSGNQITLDLTGVQLPPGRYRVVLEGSTTPLGMGLEAWYTFDDGYADVVTDSSGQENHGTSIGGYTWAQGIHSGAIQLDGTSGFVETNIAKHLPLWSVSCWTRSPTAPDNRLNAGPAHKNENFEINWNHKDDIYRGAALVRVNGQWNTASFGTLDADTWYFLSATFDGDYLRAYKDGVLVTEVTTPHGVADIEPETIKLGRHAAGPIFFEGLIDDLRIYGREISAAEVEALYNGERSGAGYPGVADSPCIRALAGAPLDGENSGTLPSGDGIPGGRFISEFEFQPPPPQVTALTPAPDSILTAAPGEVIATFGEDLDPTSVDTSTCQLYYAGNDNLLGTADDILVTPAGVAPVFGEPDKVRLDLTGASLSAGKYRIVLSGLPGDATDLIAYWKLDESSGNVAFDSSGNLNGGLWSINGTQEWTSGRRDGGLHFVSGNSYVETVNSTGPLGTSDFSTSFWIKSSDATSYFHVLGNRKSTAHANFWQVIVHNTGHLCLEIDESEQGTNYCFASALGASILDGQWHHCATVREGAALRVYVDGILKGSANGPGIANMTNDTSMVFGNSPYIGYPATFHGSLDEVQVWNRVLGPAEIKTLAKGNAIRNAYGVTLDGEYSGIFPSGNGTEGGGFMTDFQLDMTPLANDDQAAVDEEQSVSIDVAGNDFDAVPGIDVASIQVVTGTMHGTLLVNTDGTVDYTNDGSENASDSFTYMIKDTGGVVSNEATVSISINPVNDKPVANDDSASVDEGQSVNIDVANNDTDADNALDLTSIQIVASAAHGSLNVKTDGTVDYTHDGSENFTDLFTYTIKDASAAVSNTATVSITVNAVNDKPVANDDSGNVDEGQTVNADLADNDTDADNALDLTSVQIVTSAAHGSLSVKTDGTVDYAHDGSENFSDSFTYTIKDASAAVSNTATVSITINAVNDKPVANDNSSGVNEGQSVNIDVANNDTDAENALDLTSVQIVSGVSHGSLQVNADGTVDYTHDGSENFTDSFTYTIDDATGATSNTATVSITVNPVNDKPVANEDSASVNEGQTVNADLADNDTDAEDGLDLTSIQIVASAAHGSLNVNTDGTVDYTHDGSENFSDSFTYTIDDSSGATSNTATVSITINPVNDKPVAGILGSDPFYVEENELLPFDGTGTDAEDGTNVTYDWDWDDGTPDGTAQNPSHAWDEPGLYIVTLVVTDQDGLSSDPVTVQVIVTPKAGERDLFLKRGKFMINWKAHNEGVDKDSFSVQGYLNPAGCNANLFGATFEVSVNGVSLGLAPLASNGKGSTATAKASLKAKTGAFSVSIKDADLRAAFGLSNTAEAGTMGLAVRINVQNAGLYTDTITAHAQFDYTTKQDISSKGSFNFKTADSADGYFFAAKTTVTEDRTGAHKVSVKGYFDAPGGASLVPAGDVTLTVGAESITVPAVNLMVSGGIISLPKGAHLDLAKFILDTNKELFTIQTNALAFTGVPPVGNPATSHDLLLRIEIPTAGDLMTFETTVEILRSSPTSKVWKR